MTRLIDADALLEDVRNNYEGVEYWRIIERITNAPTVQQSEPFGYFKAEPFGWTDCAETDEGAIALYEAPTVQREGWVSVPIEPTWGMLEASLNSISPWNILDAYKAMIQAAPKE